jgi:hypothetical protein
MEARHCTACHLVGCFGLFLVSRAAVALTASVWGTTKVVHMSTEVCKSRSQLCPRLWSVEHTSLCEQRLPTSCTGVVGPALVRQVSEQSGYLMLMHCYCKQHSFEGIRHDLERCYSAAAWRGVASRTLTLEATQPGA